MAQQPISLQSPVGDGEETSFGDFIEDKSSENPSDVTSFSLLKDKLTDVLSSLSERERKVLELRFGLGDGAPRTLEEVGKQFRVTRERIRQIEAKALRKNASSHSPAPPSWFHRGRRSGVISPEDVSLFPDTGYPGIRFSS